jgi:AraC-like DNA-binding protein
VLSKGLPVQELLMRYVTQSVFKIVEADADEMSEHYARTLSPAKVEPLYQHSLISVEDRHFAIGRCSIWNGRCHSGMRVTLAQAPDVYVLYLPSSGVMEIDTGRKRLTSKPAIGLLGDMSHFEKLTLHEARGHMGVAFEKSAMIQQLSELLDAPVVGGIDFADTLDLATAKGGRIAALSHFVWSCLDVEEADQPSSAFIERMLQAMMIALLETVPNNYSARLAKPVSPAIPKRLKRAIEYMHANISSPMAVADIAREAGASVRALQAAFQQFKDTTPLNYLRTIRLEGARKALTDPAVSLPVAEIARNWGFSHMGRFAALYHQSFGEMPSNTAKMGRGGS